jgi:hypothetical protein
MYFITLRIGPNHAIQCIIAYANVKSVFFFGVIIITLPLLFSTPAFLLNKYPFYWFAGTLLLVSIKWREYQIHTHAAYHQFQINIATLIISTNRKPCRYLFWNYPLSRQWGIGSDQLLHLDSGVLYVNHHCLIHKD